MASVPPAAPSTPATIASDAPIVDEAPSDLSRAEQDAAPADQADASATGNLPRELVSDRSAPVILNREIPYPAPKHRPGQTKAAIQASLGNLVAEPTWHAAPEEYPGPDEYQGPELADSGPAWHASHPHPGEPLGFSGAMARPTVPPTPMGSSLLHEKYMPVQEPLDPHGPAPAVSSGEWVRDGYWYSQQSAVYMSRSVSVHNSTILAIELFATPAEHDNPFLQIPLDMGWEPGLRSTLGRHIGRDCRNRDHSIEFTYLGLTHWGVAGGLQAQDQFGLFTPIDPTQSVPIFNGSDFQSFDLTSSFNSFELNYRIERRLARDRLVYTRDSTWVRQATPALLPGMFAGIRVVDIDEQLLWLADSDSAPAGTGSYLVTTHNRMVGPQAGVDLFYERADWRLGVRAKGAALVNWASQQSTVRILDANGDPLEPDRDEFAKMHDAAFVGELNFIGSYHLRPNIALRVSYDLMWVTNLALAQNQLTFNPALPAELSNSHSLFFQGLSLGLEWAR
jgi:hypothetical protein